MKTAETRAEEWEPDTVYRKIVETGESKQFILTIPKRWAREMGIVKGQYVQLDFGVMRDRITIKHPPAAARKGDSGSAAAGKKGDGGETTNAG